MAKRLSHVKGKGCMRGRYLEGESCLDVRAQRITLAVLGADETVQSAACVPVTRTPLHTSRLARGSAWGSKRWCLRITIILSGSAKSASSVQVHQPASLPIFGKARRTLSLRSKQSVPTFRRTVRLQRRRNLDGAGMVHTRLFHRICKLGEADGTPLCRMYFLFLHNQRF